MFTVNYGTGTAEEAARWVAYAKNKNANVKYWEIGNELYGSWHANHCTPDEYGKKAREFAIQMKKADPNAHITAVWMLDGDWNEGVFKHVKDVVDGVNVHHYPQNTGQENDAGLLAAPQTLNEILPAVRKQLEEFGVPGKKYEIWLTEWNSVDFEPGPQTMTIVNALFVADYLGMLAHHNIDQASYWDVHNDVTPQGGDYGYLSRSGAPDGDNVPRSSYWAFKMASQSLGRGSLLESSTGNDLVSTYLTKDGKKQSLMIVNKYPKTVADVTINIPGFEGKAKKQQLTSENSGSPGKKGTGPKEETVDVKPGVKLSLPAHSLTTLTIE
jgi:alpha-L-arabinofuranosidase